jgi:hypothetical protein
MTDDEASGAFDVYRDGTVHVLSVECVSCIFRSVNDGRIRLRPGRVAGMVLDARADQTIIPCHDTLYRDDVRPAICRGYFDRNADRIDALQIAQRLDMVTYDDPPPKER